MTKIFWLILFFFLSYAFADCPADLKKFKGRKITLRYAKGFEIVDYKQFKLLTVGKDRYLLTKAPEMTICQELLHINIPVKRIISFSTTHLPALDLLNVAHLLKGFSNLRYVNTPSIKDLISKGEVKEVGYPPDTESILALSPDIVFTYAASSLELENLKKISELKIPIVGHLDYQEDSALGRAEWLRFIAAFLDKDQEAETIFKNIYKTYENLASLTKKTKTHPKVLIGQIDSSGWKAPGGKSDFASLVKDAGADYLWNSDNRKQTLIKDLEGVFIEAGQADFWLPQNSWKTQKEILLADGRYKLLPVMQKNNVYNIIKRKNEGNDYWETAVARPDLLLKDLISIFHPEILPNYEAFWYQRLK